MSNVFMGVQFEPVQRGRVRFEYITRFSKQQKGIARIVADKTGVSINDLASDP